MKFAIVLFAALFAVSTASQVSKAELEKGFTDFLSGLVSQVLLPPLTTTIQTSAELLAQLTAGVAIGGIDALTGLFGKRSAEAQRIIDLLTDLTNQVIQPAIDSAVQSLAGMLAQITLSVVEGGLPALTSILSGLLG